MEKEFVPYELALRMKALGYNKPCLTWYLVDEDDNIELVRPYWESEFGYTYNSGLTPECVIAPTWQSAFRWLIPLVDEEYKVCFEIDGWYIYNLENEVYEGIKSLEKLIEIVESKSE